MIANASIMILHYNCVHFRVRLDSINKLLVKFTCFVSGFAPCLIMKLCVKWAVFTDPVLLYINLINLIY